MTMNEHDDRDLDEDDHVVDPRRLLDADDQQGRDQRDDEHRREVDERRDLGKRREVDLVLRQELLDASSSADQPCRMWSWSAIASGTSISFVPGDEVNWAGMLMPKSWRTLDDVARPADRDRRGADHVFEDQVPADQPGDELAHRGIGVGVGRAGDRHGRGHLGVAEAGEGAGDAAEDERERDRRARRSRPPRARSGRRTPRR